MRLPRFNPTENRNSWQGLNAKRVACLLQDGVYLPWRCNFVGYAVRPLTASCQPPYPEWYGGVE